MKKAVLMLLVASMIASLFPTSIVAGSADFTVISGFNFNNSSNLPDNFADSVGTASIDASSFENDLLHKNALKLGGSSTGYPKITYSFEQIEPVGNSLYVETEFDLISQGLSAAGAHITISMSNKVKTLYLRCTSAGGLFIGENANGEQLANTRSITEWTRYKIVMQLTDEEGNAVNKIVGVYANGENAMVNPENTYDFNESNAKYKSFAIQLSKKSGDYSLWIDNFSIRKYNSDTGESPVPEKIALGASVVAVKQKLEENKELISGTEYDEFSQTIENLLAVYNNFEASIEDVQTAKNDIAQLSIAIDEAAKPSEGGGGTIGDGYRICGYENFDNGTKNFTLTDSGGLTENTDEFSENIFIGNSLKFKNSDQTTVYPSIYFIFNGTPTSAAQGAAPGTYVETSFDYKSAMTSGKNVTFRFCDGTKTIATLVLSGKAINLDTYNGENIANIPDMTDWVNLKFVMQMTDADGQDIRKITAIYANGQNVMVKPVSFSGGSTYSALNVSMSNKKETDDPALTFGMYFDNFCVTSYSSVDGISKAPDRNALKIKGTNVLNNLETRFKDDDKYLEMKNEIIQCAEVYKNPDASAESINESIIKLDDIGKKLNALSALKASGEDVYIYEPTLSADSLESVSQVSAEIALVTGKTKGFKASFVGVLFEKSDVLFGGKLISVVSKPINMDKDDIERVTLDFDLRSYTNAEKEHMYIKVFLIDNLAAASAVNRDVYSFFYESEVIDSSKYSFNGGVSARKKITGDNNQKIVITVCIPNDNSSISNNVTAVVLKKDLDLNSLSGIVQNDVEFISQSTADEYGNIVFEFTPSGGNGSYFYIINGEKLGRAYTGKIYYSDAETINDAFADLYENRTEACLNNYKDILDVNTAIYENSRTSGVNIANILDAVLDKKTYTAYTMDEFADSFNSLLSLVYGVKTAASTDALDILLKKNSVVLRKGAELLNLSSFKFYNACCYILDYAEDVTDISTLNSLIEEAVSFVNASEPSGGSGKSGGGGSSGYVSMGSAADAVPVPPTERVANLFNDINDVEWAKQAIYTFAAANFINGKSDGLFAPNDIITREEFVKIAVNAFGLFDSGATSEFEDVYDNSWYSVYVASAVKAGIVNGIDSKTFGVGMAITREEMAAVIYRILLMKNANITQDGVYVEFNDEFQFSDYSKEAIIALAKSGIVNGVGGNAFLPKESSTRAQAVKMLYEAYKCL